MRIGADVSGCDQLNEPCRLVDADTIRRDSLQHGADQATKSIRRTRQIKIRRFYDVVRVFCMVYGTGGCRFESCWVRYLVGGVDVDVGFVVLGGEHGAGDDRA